MRREEVRDRPVCAGCGGKKRTIFVLCYRCELRLTPEESAAVHNTLNEEQFCASFAAAVKRLRGEGGEAVSSIHPSSGAAGRGPATLPDTLWGRPRRAASWGRVAR